MKGGLSAPLKSDGQTFAKRFALLATSGPLRIPLLVFTYGAIFAFSSFLSLSLRFDFRIQTEFFEHWVDTLAWVLALKIAILGAFGQFRSLLTFFSFPDAKLIFASLGLAALVQLATWFAVEGEGMIPRGTIVVDFLISFLGVAGLRTGLRILREHFWERRAHPAQRKRVAILGAGEVGASLAREIQSKPGLGMEVVCFLDDDRLKIGRTLHGYSVVAGREGMAKTLERLGIAKCIIAMPGAPPGVISECVAVLNGAGIDHDILPSVDSILNRGVSVNHLRHVAPEDLLGRPPVRLDEESITSLIVNSTVLVTGAGGSIGRELCRQIADHRPARLMLVERAEPALFEIEQELLRDHPEIPLQAFAANVCEEVRLENLFSSCKPRLVFHAAAHKHVPLMESQPSEAVWNNAFGTLFCARAAAAHGCEKFVLVSTDKAVDPTGAMGASKRLAELAISELQNQPGIRTRFCAVRFGNVLDSSGSVVTVFRRQIAAGGPVTVTHPLAERYFMSIPEAVGLILQGAAFAEAGDVFVLDMGLPVRILDLARQMITLQGFEPERDIPIHFSGLRPGEKLRETPFHDMEKVTQGPHPKVRRIAANGKAPSVLEALESGRWRLPHMDFQEVRVWIDETLGLPTRRPTPTEDLKSPELRIPA